MKTYKIFFIYIIITSLVNVLLINIIKNNWILLISIIISSAITICIIENKFGSQTHRGKKQ